MQKTADFASIHYERWPQPHEIEHYFLAPPGQRWFFETGDDTARFDAEWTEGTEHLKRRRRNASLALMAHPTLGVCLQWSKWDGNQGSTFFSKGDLTRLRRFVRNSHDTPISVGLLVPFDVAWKAVKEFLETDGQLPSGIEWIDDKDLSSDVFPDPHDPMVEERLFRPERDG